MQQLKCSKRFLQEKITFDTTFVMNPMQGRWLLVYKKSSYFWYNNNVVSRTICMNLIESFFYDCNSAQLTNQLPILVTATWTWLMYSVLFQLTRIIKINEKKYPTKVPSKGKIKLGKMQKRVTQCKAVWCRHKSD